MSALPMQARSWRDLGMDLRIAAAPGALNSRRGARPRGQTRRSRRRASILSLPCVCTMASGCRRRGSASSPRVRPAYEYDAAYRGTSNAKARREFGSRPRWEAATQDLLRVRDGGPETAPLPFTAPPGRRRQPEPGPQHDQGHGRPSGEGDRAAPRGAQSSIRRPPGSPRLAPSRGRSRPPSCRHIRRLRRRSATGRAPAALLPLGQPPPGIADSGEPPGSVPIGRLPSSAVPDARATLRACGSRINSRRAELSALILPSAASTQCSEPRMPARAVGTSRTSNAIAGLSAKPSNGLEPLTPSLPWRCSTN